MCTYFHVRTRIAAREAASTNQPVHFGAAAVPAGGAEAGEGVRESVARFLHTFPTFKFSEERVSIHGLSTLIDVILDGSTDPHENAPSLPYCQARENQPSIGKSSSLDADEDDELVCTICLGTFCDEEECRMLPCLHVFHRACIDQVRYLVSLRGA